MKVFFLRGGGPHEGAVQSLGHQFGAIVRELALGAAE